MATLSFAVGLNKGFPTEKKARVARRAKGAKTPKAELCREVVREVSGLLAYERRLLDMLKTGGTSAEKRMYKFAKKRLGTHKRALRKRDDIKDLYSRMRARA
uniref:60S ribosomal protein L36 n=1 Tax=Rhizochromulina marina TaxID=1034831 RepID=A0A7S2SC28_9STRA|eukprot:CAMPEP_0118962094 /NCGR_PEP_ID=MMETSP1173-20130426/552_1 /TAXON_ID=1034831 /ORGANISM="Rhizochromulina marina cf, Strain CCMP1243" /LENGTH=101 /DNA_ID=CAMNT_0006910313 /DNA_START=33 /DNA_END=338 /DNA_ORIENTATION=+